MGKFFNIVAVGALGASLLIMRKKSREKAAEEERRKNIHCNFDDGFSQEEFDNMVRLSGKHIKRLRALHTDGPIIYGTVLSKSGISAWKFELDFNDYGHITGRYWISTDNNDSDIPTAIANNVKTYIEQNLSK